MRLPQDIEAFDIRILLPPFANKIDQLLRGTVKIHIHDRTNIGLTFANPLYREFPVANPSDQFGAARKTVAVLILYIPND